MLIAVGAALGACLLLGLGVLAVTVLRRRGRREAGKGVEVQMAELPAPTGGTTEYGPIGAVGPTEGALAGQFGSPQLAAVQKEIEHQYVEMPAPKRDYESFPEE